MSKHGVIDQLYDMTKPDALFHGITAGEVVDTNDPQQMGRVRAICPALGDTKIQPIKHIPWAMYAPPFGGVTSNLERGPESEKSSGPVGYGSWGIPKKGATVLIACLDGNPAHRVWLACLHGQSFTHTMPHGRYTTKKDELPDGPLTSTEEPIQPLYDSMSVAFGGGAAPPRKSFEFISRGADNQLAYVSPLEVSTNGKFSSLSDDRNELISEADGNTLTFSQGYSKSRSEPDLEFPNTDGINFDSQIYSQTTPGFHSLSMDDRSESCRIRLRTTKGNQIILDDTNERIYVSTSTGNTWIEIDEAGLIDIYASKDISFKAGRDINFTAEKTIRMSAKEGIHLNTDDELRLYAKEDIHIQTDKNIRSFSTETTRFESNSDIHVLATTAIYSSSGTETHYTSGTSMNFESATSIDVKSGTTLNLESATATNVLSGATISLEAIGIFNIDGSAVNLNSGGSATSASIATQADVADQNEAFVPSRTPNHEPWARTYNDLQADGDTGNVVSPEYGYSDKNVGRKSDVRNVDLSRNDKWHR